MIVKKIIAGCLTLSMLSFSVGCSQKKHTDMHNTNAGRDIPTMTESENEDADDATSYSSIGWLTLGVLSIIGAVALFVSAMPRPVAIEDNKGDDAP
ncbi:MAG: hypothetical protein D3910_08445 [Candidatus Electrothrix sp. ATG2]|nr:hypothetical protein [Candidatus Electrothrix sp. ATG2]